MATTKIPIQFRIEEELHAKLKIAAKRHGRSLNNYVEHLLSIGVEQDNKHYSEENN